MTEGPRVPVESGFRLVVRVVCFRTGFAGLRWERDRVGGLALGVTGGLSGRWQSVCGVVVSLTLPPTRQFFNSSKQHPPLEPSPPRVLEHNAGLQIRPGYTNDSHLQTKHRHDWSSRILCHRLTPPNQNPTLHIPDHKWPRTGRDITQRKTTGLSPTQGMVAPRCLQQCTSSPEKTQYLATLIPLV